MNTKTIPEIAILLCTYNGQAYLNEQLDSIATQTYPYWALWVSDDGSKDDTLSILTKYKSKWSTDRLSIKQGPQKGFATNFLTLSCREDIQAEYYAFCDQDDIWEVDKLQNALRHLETIPANMPALYMSRTLLVDADNHPLGLSPHFHFPPSFIHALTQNMATGNTMIFNHAACLLLREAGKDVSVVAHDWWLYLLVTGVGGKIFSETNPTLRYRQHNNNVVGMKTHWLARMVRLRTLINVCQGKFRAGNDRQLKALLKMNAKLTPQNRQILKKFMKTRNQGLFNRLLGFWQIGIYREPLWSHLGLIIAAIFKKI